MKTLDDNLIIQVAVAVEDIEKTARSLADIFGVDVPEIMDLHDNKEEYVNYYKGKKTDSYTKTCYFKMGQLDLELVQPVGNNIEQRDFLKKNKGSRMHHIAFNVKNIDQKARKLEEKGLKVVQRTKFPGGKCILLSFPEIGANLELLEGSSKPQSDN
jgi:methylmalonyl-CoA/ethylmalonyl-CoA epimerase